jgi:hypothetical protein
MQVEPSGFGTPEAIVASRTRNHHMTAQGFGNARVDRAADGTVGRVIIRGREQQLIDHHGGARREGGTSGNTIRGVAKFNAAGRIYHHAASSRFGELHPYTGY